MSETEVRRAVAYAAPVILILISMLFAISFLIASLLGLPFSLGLPTWTRVLGGAIVVAGVAVTGWLFRYRSPANMIVSTYVTLSKLFRRTPVAEPAGRTEPLVLIGPQRYVRHPLYFSVIIIVLGCALLTTYTFVLIATVIILLWFRFVMIPFEERELCALFGDQYLKYMDETPMLVTFTKRKRHPNATRTNALSE